MYCDPILWKNVRDCVLEDGMSRRGAASKFGLARNTVRKMLLNDLSRIFFSIMDLSQISSGTQIGPTAPKVHGWGLCGTIVEQES